MKVLLVASFLESDGYKNYTMPFIDRQMESLKSIGIDIIPFSIKSYKNKLNYLKKIFSINNIIKSQNISIIHAHYSYSSIPCSFQNKVPIVVSLMGTDVYGRVGYSSKVKVHNYIDRIILNMFSRKWDAIIVKSEEMKQYIRHPNIYVIPNGVDFRMFAPMDKRLARELLNLNQYYPIILFAGDPDRQRKNFPLAKEVYKIVSKKIRNLLMIPLKNIPHMKVPLYLNAASCLLMTSIKEGSPNIVKEALACNVPVVSVNVGDVLERLDGLEMCSVCEYDAKKLADEVEKIIRSGKRPNNRDKIGYLEINNVATHILSVYKKCLRL